jgi:hypothetical protein
VRTAPLDDRVRLRVLVATAAAGLVLLAAGCTAKVANRAAYARPSPRDPHTAAALFKIARAFNYDYETGVYRPVYARWDARSQAIVTRADYIERHEDCPSGAQILSRTEDVSSGGPDGVWLVHYELGGQQLIDYWFYVRHRWEFDLLLSNPAAANLYRLSPAKYVAAIGCAH